MLLELFLYHCVPWGVIEMLSGLPCQAPLAALEIRAARSHTALQYAPCFQEFSTPPFIALFPVLYPACLQHSRARLQTRMHAGWLKRKAGSIATEVSPTSSLVCPHGNLVPHVSEWCADVAQDWPV